MLHVSAGCGKTNCISYLLHLGADPNAIDILGICITIFNRTPLHYAVQYGNNESIRLLLEAGAKVNAKDGAGISNIFFINFTPLHLAANIGDVSKCELLYINKANLNVTDDTGLTPLHWATTSQKLDCVEYFLNQGVNTDIRDLVGVLILF